VHIPNPDPELCQGVGIRKKKRIRNNIDEAEARPVVVMCYKCHNTGHMYKRCTSPNYAYNALTTASGLISNFRTISTLIPMWTRTWTWASD
jgi:hypothetical protein